MLALIRIFSDSLIRVQMYYIQSNSSNGADLLDI